MAEALVPVPGCRSCGRPLDLTFVDLGLSPLSNSYLDAEALAGPERFYPLHARVCRGCWLVQLPQAVAPEEIFSDYAYFSSYSDTWVEHARRYAAEMTERLGLGPGSRVVEIASNDGYLLQFFAARGIPVLGIEPAANVAKVAVEKGIPTWNRFFGPEAAAELAAPGKQADLLLGNNVLAHVPALREFVQGLRTALAPRGVITMEFPHLLRLIDENQFDTIYHEHFSYFSLIAVEAVFAREGLAIHDVEELPTHGGSLRIFASHAAPAPRAVSARVKELREREAAAGLASEAPYRGFAEKVAETKRRLLGFLIEAKRKGLSIAGYGAPAKGNTLLNYCGIRIDFLDYTVDRSPHKQGMYLPGTRIPIHAPERLRETRPDYVLILPWNIRDEIMGQMAHVREWGGRFVVAIPEVRVLG